MTSSDSLSSSSSSKKRARKPAPPLASVTAKFAVEARAFPRPKVSNLVTAKSVLVSHYPFQLRRFVVDDEEAARRSSVFAQPSI